MDSFQKINADDLVSESFTKINNTFLTLLSNSSGTAFPTSNLYAGRAFYKTDTHCLYMLKTENDSNSWEKVLDLAIEFGTINGHTVETSVPANAKFTDTLYIHPESHPASMITGLPDVYAWAKAATKPNYTASEVGAVAVTSIGNAANKIPIYNASGHLVLPDGSEIWVG